MNIKLNTICFILLLFLLIGVVSATDSDNETLKQTIDSHEEICQVHLEHPDKLEAKINTDKLEASKTKQTSAAKSAKSTSSKKSAVTISAPNLKMYYKDGSKFTVTLKDSSKKVMKSAKVKISINGKTYTKTTDSKGKASLTISLKSGTYPVTVTFDETKTHYKKSVQSSVTVKSTIKCSDFTKYYTNKAAYSSTFYNNKGKLLKSESVKFKIHEKTYSVKTNSKGVAKLSISLKPGTYSISSINSKTSETATKKVTVKSILESYDLVMTEKDGSKFNVKVLNSGGKASPNKKVTLKVNGATYTPKSDSKGIASQTIDLGFGQYTITTEYEGLKNTNIITVNKAAGQNTPSQPSASTNPIKNSEFVHTTSIPNYVNVTVPYAFHNSDYTLKVGSNGIVKMPKAEVFIIETDSGTYHFTTAETEVTGAMKLDYKSYFIPFYQCALITSVNKDTLDGNGIIITRTPTSTEIDYRDLTKDNTELFGFYADKSTTNSETFTYLKNDKVMAKVTVQTQYYDERGVKYNLAKLFNKPNLNFNYDEIMNYVANPVVFTNTGTPVTYSYFSNFISGYPTREDITTRFTINGREELEKTEQISYGLGTNYRSSLGFEVLQSYSIINEKMTTSLLENWINKNSAYLSRFGVMHVYGMHLASLETVLLADEIADEYEEELNVTWKRENTVTILGGINMNKTYLHILNADMGMNVSGDDENCTLFRLMNSFYLPNIEDYVLNPVGERYLDNATNSIYSILNAVENNNFSIVQMGETFYILSENGENTTIVIDSATGIANVILVEDNFAYKGAVIQTACDCCSVSIIAQDIIKGIKNTLSKLKSGAKKIINTIIKKINPLCSLLFNSASFGGTIGGIISPSIATGLSGSVGMMLAIHKIGNIAKNDFVDKKDWHWAYEHITFTRDSMVENKKFFNIPKEDGTYDYIEVEINDDGSLNRNKALYVSEGSTKKLTKSETYKYFSEETWTLYNIPKKYQKNKMP